MCAMPGWRQSRLTERTSHYVMSTPESGLSANHHLRSPRAATSGMSDMGGKRTFVANSHLATPRTKPSLERFAAVYVRRSLMPAKSAAQQKAAGAALSAKRGDTPKSKLRGASKSMASSMSENELEKMAKTSRKGKPEHKS
jgi:hypothetical protein